MGKGSERLSRNRRTANPNATRPWRIALVILVLISAVPLFSAVRLSAWRLLSLFTQISGRPSQAPDWPRPFPIHPAARSCRFPRMRAGISDARARRPPYIMGILLDAQGRRALL